MKAELREVAIGWPGNLVAEDVNLTLDFAEWNYRVPLVGKSGCGKSTLMYAISGLMGLVRGDVHWTFADGGEASLSASETASAGLVRSKLRHRRFSFAFQDSALLPHLTVRENLRYPADIAKEKSDLPVESIEDHLVQTLSTVLIEGEDPGRIMTMLPRQLSGGQRRRVAIAQAMITLPEILFLDEPAGGLDPHTKTTVMATIDRWVDAAAPGTRAMVWVTHHLDEDEFHACRQVLAFRTDANPGRAGLAVLAVPSEQILQRVQ